MTPYTKLLFSITMNDSQPIEAPDFERGKAKIVSNKNMVLNRIWGTPLYKTHILCLNYKQHACYYICKMNK